MSKSYVTKARGASSVEYALVIVAISVGIGAAARVVGRSVSSRIGSATTMVDPRCDKYGGTKISARRCVDGSPEERH